MINNKKIKIYFIGIGGIGMSGIAEVMHEIGFAMDVIYGQATDKTFTKLDEEMHK